LIINNLDKSEIKEFPMEYKNNEFVSSYTLDDESRYELKVRIEGSGFIRESEIKAIGVQNRKPALGIKIGNIRLWNSNNKNIILSQYFTDEDKDKLKYSISNDNSDVLAAEINGDTLTLQGKKIGGGTITIVCDDSKGGKVSTEIKVNVFFIGYIYGIICLILSAVLLILIRKVIKGKNTDILGQVMIQIKDSSAKAANQSYYKSLSSFKGSFSMHDLLNLDPAYAETGNIILKAGKNDTLIITNKSQCILESYGKKISKRFIMKNNYKIVILLNNKNISVNLQYFSS
jgi:hypothetical protein